MSLKLQQTTGTGGSGSGRRIGPASKTNRAPATHEVVIDVDEIDNLPLSQSINQKSTNQTIDLKSDGKKSLIPIPTTIQVSSPSTQSNEIKNTKETNSPKSTNDKKDNNKNVEKNGHNNDQSKLSTPSQQQQQQQSQKETKPTNGHKNDDGNNKKLNQLSTNVNEEQNSKTKEDKSKTNTDEQSSNNVVVATESEKSGAKSRKLSEKEKKKSNDEIPAINNDVQSPQPTVITPPKRTSQRAAAIQANVSLASLANEKELKGFNEVGDEEMESLLLQIDTSDQVEKAKPLLTPTKAISNVEKKNERENKKRIENKKDETQSSSPTTQKSIIKTTTTTSVVPFSKPPITSTPDAKQHNSFLPRPTSASVRSISGRRSLRPMNKEYSFQNTTNYRESYRKLQTDLDLTGNTSLNVTVGSEQPDQLTSISSSSFSFFGRGKKRERTSPQESLQKSPEHCQLINDGGDNELDTSVSKRARLDFSGFFGIVASPVTMLRARLSRAKIESTPKSNNYDDIEEGVENFSGIITGDNKKNDNILDDNKVHDEEEDVDVEDVSMKEDESEKLKNVIDISNATAATEDDEIIVTEVENRRRMCLLM